MGWQPRRVATFGPPLLRSTWQHESSDGTLTTPPADLDEAAPPRFFQLALGIDKEVEAGLDADELLAYNLRTASTVLTALRQRALHYPVLLPLNVQRHILAGKEVAAELKANEEQDAAFADTYQHCFTARRVSGTETLAAAMLAVMSECEVPDFDRQRIAELDAVRGGTTSFFATYL